jgi:Zn-dependent protease
MPQLSYRQKQIGCALLTFAVYSWVVNWQAALVLMGGIAFHECSHLWAARYLGMRTSGFFLLPFVGGVALVQDRYRSYGQQAFVVLMGPVGGGLLALATAGLYYVTGFSFLAAAALWMFFLNLFNLFPLSFLDGGQLLDTVSYSLNRNFGFGLRVASTVAAVVVLGYLNAWVILFFILLFGGSSIFQEYNNWKHYRAGDYHLCTESYLYPPDKLKPWEMLVTLGGWVLTVFILLMGHFYLAKYSGSSMINLFRP